METLTEDQIIARYSANLLNAQEASDGWMQAYYRQTSRLLRAESALRDIAQIADNATLKVATNKVAYRRISDVATSTLEVGEIQAEIRNLSAELEEHQND